MHRAGSNSQGEHPQVPTIFRVRQEVRRRNRYAYEPKVVIIGPYHRGKYKNFQATENLKRRLRDGYLSNVPNGSNNEDLIRNMRGMEDRARACYSEEINMNVEQFVEMLLLDGCFLVQIFRTFRPYSPGEWAAELFGNKWLLMDVMHDLLLLENQIPYFIVRYLDTLGEQGWNSSGLQNTAIKFFSDIRPEINFEYPRNPVADQEFQVDHLLDLLHQWNGSLSSVILQPAPPNDRESFPSTIPTATELEEAGVKIKVKKETCFLDISFSVEKGVLEIPAIQIGGLTNVLFANLIAFEQTRTGRESFITTYAKFLDDIINIRRDVELLHKKGIMHRWLADDKAIASLINKLNQGTVLNSETYYLRGQYKDLNVYCQATWPRWRAKAMHDYFNTPWAFFSLAAAVVLLVATILQTVYSILSYYKA